MELSQSYRSYQWQACYDIMPFNSGSLFYNYESYFSIVLLAVASADYRFVMVDVGAYGSSNDSGVLNHTTFFK